MENATKQTLRILSDRGHRITDARTRVVRALAQASTPMTIQELADRVSVDEVSVYRTVDLLHEEELVEEITVRNQRPHYALAHGHHHHVICRNCGFIAHVSCPREPQAPRNVRGFAVIDAHDVTFYGMCATCA